MSRLGRAAAQIARFAWLFLRAGGENVVVHWGLAGFSVVAAFGVWFVIQDVENPRIEGVAPATDPAILVTADNVPEGSLASDLPRVKVKVEARKQDLPTLRSGDFVARVDVKGMTLGVPDTRAVHVVSKRDGVRVLSVDPASVQVTLEEAKTKDVAVQVRRTSLLPIGYRETDAPGIEPAFVRVLGRPEQVDSVSSVDIDVGLSGVREPGYVAEGDLVARTESGNTVDVVITPSRARVTFKIEQTLVQRAIGITPQIVGVPAAGYRVANVTVDPPTAQVTGPSNIVDKLQTLGVEKLDVTGAKTDVTQSRSIDKPPNTLVDRQTVVVKVEIKPIECGGTQTGVACGWATVVVAVGFEPQAPLGLQADAAVYFAQVRVSGSVAQIQALKPADIKATVSLAGAVAGTAVYPVTATIDPKVTGLKVETVEPITITLRLGVVP
jgi:YbbR domain-containing protein